MTLKINTGLFIKTLNAAISFLDIKDELSFLMTDSGLAMYSQAPSYFRVPVVEGVQPTLTEYTVSVKDIKPISTLNSSVVEDLITLDFHKSFLIIRSNVSFNISCKFQELEKEPEFSTSEVVYQNTALIKTLSRYLNKLGKDNFKGCFACLEGGFVLPGEYHLTYLPAQIEVDTQPYLLKSVQLNKLIKLGDLSITPGGKLRSNEEIEYCVSLPKAPKETAIVNKKTLLDSVFTESLPSLTILEPKTFKTFLKNTKSDDKQYDLCSLRSETNRITLNFYKDKQASNTFVYTKVETPDSSIEVHLQTKHLLALADLAKEKIELQFSSNFEPVKIVIDDLYITYLMQGVVV